MSPTSGLETSENGSSATFSVVLTSRPSADVTLRVESSDSACGTASAELLVFTALDWNVTRIVTVTGVDDLPPAADGSRLYTIVVAAPSTQDPLYGGLPANPVSVVRTDNDQAGITVSRTLGLVTSEAGLQDSFTVVLNTAPAYPVTIDLWPSNSDEGSVFPSSLSFDPANWMIPRAVTLSGVNDAPPRIDGPAHYMLCLSPAASADPVYAALPLLQISATNLDDDLPGIRLSKELLVTSESGTADSLQVTLATIPPSPVTIAIRIAGAGSREGDVTETIAFDPIVDSPEVILSIGKTLGVAGRDDGIVDGDVSYTLEGTVSSSSPAYDGLGFTVAVKNLDNDLPGITLDRTSLSTNEAGQSDKVRITLRSIPSAPVTITLSGVDGLEGRLSATSVVLDPWKDDFSVILVTGRTMTGLDDLVTDGPRTYILTGTPTSADPNYDGAVLAFTLPVTNHDDDDAPPGSRPTRGTAAMPLSSAPAWDDRTNVEPSVLRTGAG